MSFVPRNHLPSFNSIRFTSHNPTTIEHKRRPPHLALARRRRRARRQAAPSRGERAASAAAAAEAVGRHGELLVERHLVPGRRPRAAALGGVVDVEPREQRAHHLPLRLLPSSSAASSPRRHRLPPQQLLGGVRPWRGGGGRRFLWPWKWKLRDCFAFFFLLDLDAMLIHTPIGGVKGGPTVSETLGKKNRSLSRFIGFMITD